MTRTRNWTEIANRMAGEKLLTLAQAAKLIPTGRAKSGHASTGALYRWIVYGKRGKYLDGLKQGAGWVTSREALARFGAEIGRADVALCG